MASLVLGVFIGFLALLAVELLLVLIVLYCWLCRRRAEPTPSKTCKTCDLSSERSLPFACNKQGRVWVFEPENVPKVQGTESQDKGTKEPKNKEIIDVYPVEKHAEVKDRALILSDVDGPLVTVELLGCLVVAVSASDQSSQKWDKRYPIKVESKSAAIYGGSRICYLYLDSSWEKESWCTVLRLASCPDKKKINVHAQMTRDFQQYMASMMAEHLDPLLKSSPVLLTETIDHKTNSFHRTSRLRVLLKRVVKMAAKNVHAPVLSSHGKSNVNDKLHDSSGTPLSDGLLKDLSSKKSSCNSLQEMMQISSPSPANLENINQLPIFPNATCDEKFVSDESTLCWNLFFSRLFFDVKRSTTINSLIKSKVQKALSNMMTPSCIGRVECRGLDVGNFPPYIRKIRFLPVDLSEEWAMEVDVEYSGGMTFEIETKFEVDGPNVQADITSTTLEPSSVPKMASDPSKHLQCSQLIVTGEMDNRDEESKSDGLNGSKMTNWTSTCLSTWKAIKHSIADRVSQVMLSLTIRVTSLRGTLRLHIKPPPTDQLWFGFTSMPDIDWELDSTIGEAKITNENIALMLDDHFKDAIREAVVLPNYESICIPWMYTEKDDWVPLTAAPFKQVNQNTTTDIRDLDAAEMHIEEVKSEYVDSEGSKTSPSDVLDAESIKNAPNVRSPSEKFEFITSPNSPVTPDLFDQLSHDSMLQELSMPVLESNETQDEAASPLACPYIYPREIVPWEEHTMMSLAKDQKPRRASGKLKMMGIRKIVEEKFEEKKRKLGDKGKQIVEKMRETTRT